MALLMLATGKVRKVIVNADDLGFSPAVTAGIIRAHTDGLVTSATLAANMPHAPQAAEAVKGLSDLGVGVHLNVSQGLPLSVLGRCLAGADGRMSFSATGIILALMRRPTLLDAVSAEFEAQVRRALDLGVKVTHLDSHRHTHAYPPVFGRVLALARKYDIPFVRRHREVLPGRWPAAPARQRRISRVLSVLGTVNARQAGCAWVTGGTWGVAHTGLIDPDWLVRAARALPPGVTEIMVHPGLPEEAPTAATRLAQSRPRELAALCDPRAVEAFEKLGIQLVNYGSC